MVNDINLWLQGHLSTNDYAKVSSVENVWMSDGVVYARIPGNYVDSKNIYYKNRNGELFGIGDIGSDTNSYRNGYKNKGSYSDYINNDVIGYKHDAEILFTNKVIDGNPSTVCILPSSQITGYTNYYYGTYTIKNNELTYVDELGTCITRIFTTGKTAFDTSLLNNQNGKCILNSWNLGEGNTEFYNGSNEYNKDSVTAIIGGVQDISFKEITLDHIPPGYDVNTEAVLNYPDIMYGLTPNTVSEYCNFRMRLSSDSHTSPNYAGYPVIGELKDTLSGTHRKENGSINFDTSSMPRPFLHQPMLLVNRVGNIVTIVHAPDIVAYSVINFGDGSAPVIMYTNPRSYSSDMPVWNRWYNDSRTYEYEKLTFESIMYSERDYKGVHTYKTSGTFTISVDMYYLGTNMAGGSSSSVLNVTRIHSTKEIVINDDPQDLIYFKIPKEIPHLYVNGYRCPVVNTDDESNTVALNVTGYDFLEYAKIIYSNMHDMAPTISYADEDVLSGGVSYPVYDTDNLLLIAKPSFRVSVCERTDIRKHTADIVHISRSDRYDLNNDNSLATILSVFGQECETALNNTALLGPQCVGKTYDIRNLLAWSSIYANYYVTEEDVNNG